MMESLIARVIASIVLPFLLIFGLYVSFHGHLSPGGGFAGGTILGASMLLVLLVGIPLRGRKQMAGILPLLDSGGVIAYVVIGIFGLVVGTGFLSNLSAGFSRGAVGSVLSAGFMVPLGIAICLKVGATFTSLFLALGEEGDDNHEPH